MAKSCRVSEKEMEYLRELLKSGFPGSANTSFVNRLEAAFAAKFDSKYAISFTNGTATLHAALEAAGVGEGDEVIVPPLTMSSTSFAVMYLNAIPVYADIDPETFLIDAESIRKKITSRTKAIMPVSLYGLSPDMDAINVLAKKHNLAVIEDDAQCFLGMYKGKKVGTLGDIASFSFQNSKHITCGEGGMVITSNKEYAEKMRRFSSLGYGLVSAEPGKSKIDKRAIVSPNFKRHVSLGFNYRMSDLCAAFALAQLERLEEFVAWRTKSAEAFAKVVAECDWLVAQKTPADCVNSYWAYTVRLDTDRSGVTWQQFYDKFIENGGEGFYGAWGLSYLEPVFQSGQFGNYPKDLCPVAERIQPQLMQFKTNYMDDATINRQADALGKTISMLSK